MLGLKEREALAIANTNVKLRSHTAKNTVWTQIMKSWIQKWKHNLL